MGEFTFIILFRKFLKTVLQKRWLSKRILFVKALLYQIFSVIITFSLSFVITGNIDMSLGISVLDFLGKTLLYFIFDVSWWNLIKRIK